MEECELCFDYNYKRLTLEKGNLYDIDKYTSRNFCDTKEIRIMYKKQIEEFLKKLNGPNDSYANIGSIYVYAPTSHYVKKEVLLKKHIIAVDEIIKHRTVMLEFSNYQKWKGYESLVTEYFNRMVRSPWDKKGGAKSFVKQWLKEEKKGNNYYNIVRDLIYVYEKQIERNCNLRSIDYIYNQRREQNVIDRVGDLGNVKVQKDAKHEVIEEPLEESLEEEKKYNIAGSKYTVDELHLFDTEELEKIIDKEGSDYIPDVIKGSKK